MMRVRNLPGLLQLRSNSRPLSAKLAYAAAPPDFALVLGFCPSRFR